MALSVPGGKNYGSHRSGMEREVIFQKIPDMFASPVVDSRWANSARISPRAVFSRRPALHLICRLSANPVAKVCSLHIEPVNHPRVSEYLCKVHCRSRQNRGAERHWTFDLKQYDAGHKTEYDSLDLA